MALRESSVASGLSQAGYVAKTVSFLTNSRGKNTARPEDRCCSQ